MSFSDEKQDTPHHVAIIMDGNGRWAEERGLPRLQGHLEGRKATRRAVEACAAAGVKVLSVYAFSAENWRRPAKEVAGLFDLIAFALEEELSTLRGNDIRLVASGRLGELPESLQEVLLQTERDTAQCETMVLNLLVNYGGRAEIADAARGLVEAACSGRISPEEVSEESLREHLYSPSLPDPDLVIRTGGEQRISNFLLWEIAYAELVFLDVLWPDFEETHLLAALEEYRHRRRRFGGLEAAKDPSARGQT